MEERQRHGMEKMLPYIKEWESSGQTKKAFCQQRGIAPSVFHYWYKRYRQENMPEGFIQISTDSIGQPPQMEVHYPNGVSIKLPANISLTLLRQYIYL